ncbi:hypothetical protein Zmor_003048 [Zophobas morio]|uniref:Uncharacterized protein n=1 Tax=Zophobas morio TaxID=2755281 RepID=A0AA38HRB9_9CUCU|nr:hypothetical protein Zmor_003048 [Zophobas morio]
MNVSWITTVLNFMTGIRLFQRFPYYYICSNFLKMSRKRTKQTEFGCRSDSCVSFMWLMYEIGPARPDFRPGQTSVCVIFDTIEKSDASGTSVGLQVLNLASRLDPGATCISKSSRTEPDRTNR